MKRHVHLAALDLSDVGPMEFTALGERLLAQTQVLSRLPDSSANSSRRV